MAFGTTERLPTILTWEQAKKKYENTTPIRGSEKDMEGGLRPLAARRDKHLFIRPGADNSFELVCYQSPVITIHPDDRIVIQPYYQSSYTCDFIRNILWNTRRPDIRNYRGKTLLEFGYGDGVRKYLLDTDDTLVLKYDPLTGTLDTIEAPDTHVWKPNWRKLKALSAPYSEFADYYKNMVGLLVHETPEDGLPDDPFVAKHAVTVQMDTLVNLFGVQENPYKNHSHHMYNTDYLHTAQWRILMNKPVWAIHTVDMEHSMVAEWQRAAQEFLTSVRNDQKEDAENTKYANFHRAAFGLILAAFCYAGKANIPLSWPSITISKSAALGAFKELLLNAFAEEVMEKVPATPGKVPTTNYGDYLFNKGR